MGLLKLVSLLSSGLFLLLVVLFCIGLCLPKCLWDFWAYIIVITFIVGVIGTFLSLFNN